MWFLAIGCKFRRCQNHPSCSFLRFWDEHLPVVISYPNSSFTYKSSTCRKLFSLTTTRIIGRNFKKKNHDFWVYRLGKDSKCAAQISHIAYPFKCHTTSWTVRLSNWCKQLKYPAQKHSHQIHIFLACSFPNFLNELKVCISSSTYRITWVLKKRSKLKI